MAKRFLRCLLAALLVTSGVPISAQVLPGSPKNITLVSGGGTCNTPDTACATYTFGAAPSITFDISGTFTGTLTFEGTSNGATWRTISVTKLADGTTTTTTTTTGQFSISNAGLLRVRVRATAFASGQAIVYGTAGTGLAKALTPSVSTLFLADGTAAAPSLTFTLDTDTGLYRVGANDIGITTGGTLRFDISTTAVTSTLPILTGAGVAGTACSAAAPCFTFNGDSDTGIFQDAANRFSLSTGGSARSWLNAVGWKVLGDAAYVFAPSTNLGTAADTGISRSAPAGIAIGNGTVGDTTGTATLGSFTTSGASSMNATNLTNGPATAPNQVVNLANTTAATSGVTAQWSPGLLFSAPGWDVDDATSRTTHCYFTLRPISANTVTSQLQLMCETSPFNGSYTNQWRVDNGGQSTQTGSLVFGVSSSISANGRAVFQSPADGEWDAQTNLGNGGTNAGLRMKYIVEANTGAKSPTTIENNEIYTNTGDGDGSSITLLNDPPVGTVYHVAVTAAQTITITASAGETLKFGSSTCGTSLTSNTVGSAVTIIAATGGSGAIWICFGPAGTWVCNA